MLQTWREREVHELDAGRSNSSLESLVGKVN
jgi:hypothetical protein